MKSPANILANLKLSRKLTLSSLLVIVFMATMGSIMIHETQTMMKKTIGESNTALAANILDSIDREIYRYIETFQGHTKDLILQETLLESNQKFVKLKDIQRYVNKRDQQWASLPKAQTTPFIEKLLNNRLSNSLKDQKAFYNTKYGFKLIGEIFVTNKYGANAAQTNKTSDFRQDDEQWWHSAKTDGIYVSDVVYDDSAGIYSLDICLRVDDDKHHFLGVMKVVINIERIRNIIDKQEGVQEITHKKNPLGSIQPPPKSLEFKLLNQNGHFIFIPENHKTLQDRSPKAFKHLGRIKKTEPVESFIADCEQADNGKKLFAYSHSKGYREFKGLGWILVIENKTKDIFAPVLGMRNQLVLITIALILLVSIINYYIFTSVAKPANALCNAVKKIGNGQLDTRIPITSKDEIGELAGSFQQMQKDLKKTTVSIDELEKEILERKKIEAEYAESEEKFRSMVESMVDSVYITSANFTIEYMNPSMVKRVGRDASGEKCFNAIHGLDAKCEWCTLNDVADGKPFELNIVSPKDSRTYRTMHMPLYNSDDMFLKMVIDRDITDYLIVVAEKDKAQKQLLRSQKMESIGNLAGGIAHDFNNILAVIMGYSQLALPFVEKGSPVEEDINEILHATDRAKDLVRQILTFARQTEEETHPVRIDIIAKEAMKFIRSSIPSSIEIKDDLRSKSAIMGNSTQVHQILLNLCTNAAHAMKDETGVLEIHLNDIAVTADPPISHLDLKPGDYIELCISDTGAGIAPDSIGSIFEPYFTTKEVGEGTGLGLAVVHGIVEKYNGKITVESTLGQGSVFTIYLPICKKKKKIRNEEVEEIPSGTEHILFIDDEILLVKLGKRILTSLGYFVTTKTSSIEALELFQSKPDDFDLVITDMTMPNMTGDKLAFEAMKIRRDIPVIICTGFSNIISEESASEIGVKALVYKPIVKKDLAKAIRKVLEET